MGASIILSTAVKYPTKHPEFTWYTIKEGGQTLYRIRVRPPLFGGYGASPGVLALLIFSFPIDSFLMDNFS